MNLEDWKNVATIAGIVVAVATYITNSYFQFRNKRIENLKRYFDAHEKLFGDDGYLKAHIQQLEKGTYTRDLADPEQESRFNRFLGEVEKIAFLTAHGAVPTSVQVYMFGWFAQRMQPHLTKQERENRYWELAALYLDELKKAADDYSSLSTDKREKYLKKNSLIYKKFK